MKTAGTLASRLVVTGLAFLALAVASIAVNMWVTWQMEGGAAAVNEAGRMRMMSYRMAFELAAGRRDRALQEAQAFDATLALLQAGDPSRPLAVPDVGHSRQQLEQVRRRWIAFRPLLEGPNVSSESVAALVGTIDTLVGDIERELSRLNSTLRYFELLMLALAVASALGLLFTSQRLVLDPLHRLGLGIDALQGGNLRARVAREALEEFQDLAGGFNVMAERIEAQTAGLEAAVARKTAALQAERERLAALYEVSAFVANAESLDELAQGFVERIARLARADAVALRWSDDANQRYVLLAHAGLPPGFAADEQCLQAGGCHCAQAPEQSATRVIAIADAGGLGHCGRAGFRTLLTVPVRLHHRIHGEVTLLYREDVADGAIDRSLAELLCSHLAGGMEALRAAAADKESAVAAERALIAQELHDSIAQSLAFLKIQVGLLRGALQRGQAEAVRQSVDEIEAGVRESYADVRELLMHFRTRADAEDIETALRTTARKFQHQTGLPVRLALHGHGVPLPADVRIQALHIVQEALSNARKHARASAVEIDVDEAPEWRFEVRDDGIGFDPAQAPDDTHVGLRIMRERAARIGGRLEIGRAAPGGTRVCLVVPQTKVAPNAVPEPDPVAHSLAGG